MIVIPKLYTTSFLSILNFRDIVVARRDTTHDVSDDQVRLHISTATAICIDQVILRSKRLACSLLQYVHDHHFPLTDS